MLGKGANVGLKLPAYGEIRWNLKLFLIVDKAATFTSCSPLFYNCIYGTWTEWQSARRNSANREEWRTKCKRNPGNKVRVKDV